MIEKKKFLMLIVLGWLVMLIGIWSIIRNLNLFFCVPRFIDDIIKFHGLAAGIMSVIIMLLPIFRILGGIKILKRKEIGRKFVLCTSSINIILTLIGAWTAIIYFLYNPTSPIIPKDAFVQKISMIPGYILAIIDIFIIYFYTRPEIRKQFIKEGT